MPDFEHSAEPVAVTPLPTLHRVAIIAHPEILNLSPRQGRHQRGQQRLDTLKRFFSESDIIFTEHVSGSDQPAMLEVVEAVDDHCDAVVFVGGDGVHAAGLDALHTRKSQTPAWLVRGGNANDAGNAFIGPAYRNRPHRVITLGTTEHHPVDIKTTDSAGAVEHNRAHFYGSVGNAAKLGAAYDSEHFRNRSAHWPRVIQFAAESLMAAKAADRPQLLTICIGDTDYQVTDSGLLLIDRMGKALRTRHKTLGNTVSLYSARYHHLSTLLPAMGRVSLSRLPKLRPEGLSVIVHSPEGEFWEQIDGEPKSRTGDIQYKLQRSAHGTKIITSRSS